MPTKAKHQREEEGRAERGPLGSHTHISRYSPNEKGRKASLFLNCPFSRKCSGLNVSGVAHSAGSLCSAVRLVSTMVPWRRQKRLRQGLTHATYVCRGAAGPRDSTPRLTAPWTPSASLTHHLLRPAPRTQLFAMGQLTVMDWNYLLGIWPGKYDCS